MTKVREELQARRLDAVRAWTSFVELGDEATPLVRPEILRSWELSGAAITPDVVEAPLAAPEDGAGAPNGRSPVVKKYKSTPSENRSLRGSSRTPSRRSGAI